MGPVRLLLETRHSPEVVDPSGLPHRRLEVVWENEDDGDDPTPMYLCHELSRGPDDACYLGYHVGE